MGPELRAVQKLAEEALVESAVLSQARHLRVKAVSKIKQPYDLVSNGGLSRVHIVLNVPYDLLFYDLNAPGPRVSAPCARMALRAYPDGTSCLPDRFAFKNEVSNRRRPVP